MAFPELMEQKFITTLSGGKSKRIQGLYLIERVVSKDDESKDEHIVMLKLYDRISISDRRK